MVLQWGPGNRLLSLVAVWWVWESPVVGFREVVLQAWEVLWMGG